MVGKQRVLHGTFKKLHIHTWSVSAHIPPLSVFLCTYMALGVTKHKNPAAGRDF